MRALGLAALTCALLASCGGGDSSTTPPPAPTPAAPVPPPVAATPAPAPAAAACQDAKLDTNGRCAGDKLERCGVHGKPIEVSCSAIGRTCGSLPSGYATCLALDQPASSAAVSNDFQSVSWAVPLAAAGYDRVSMDINPLVAVPDDGTDQNLLFGDTFLNAPAQNQGVYGALVAVIRNHTSRSGERGVYFAVIGARVAYPVAPAEAEAGVDSVQMTMPYEWTSGRTYRLAYELVGDDPNNSSLQLIRATVMDVGANEQQRIGDVAIPKAWRLQSGFFTAVESYPLPTQSASECRSFAASDVLFTRLRAGSEQVTPTGVNQYSSTYGGPCRNGFFGFQPVTDGYRMKLGVR